MSAPLMETAESILYISALVADQPRRIDRFIDYFGGVPESWTWAAGRTASMTSSLGRHPGSVIGDRRSIA